MRKTEHKHKSAGKAAAFLLACALAVPCLRTAAPASAASGGGTALLADADLADGVHYSEEALSDFAGKQGYRLRLNHLEVNPSAGGLHILAAKAGDTVNALETVDSQAQRELAKGNKIVAGINADSFDMDYGSNRGILIQNGSILTSQPYSAYTTDQPAFFVDRQNGAHIGPLRVGGEIQIGSGYKAETDLVNRNHFWGPAGYKSPVNSTRLYTAALMADHRMVHGTGAPPAEQAYALIQLRDYDGNLHVGSTYKGQVVLTYASAGFTFPKDCVVYAGYGTKAAQVKALTAGMDVTLTYHLYTGGYTQNPDGTLKDRGTQADDVVTAVNSFQLLARGGALNHAVVDSVGTDKRARTVIGITGAGIVHIVTVSEPGPKFSASEGATMKDIANYMLTSLNCRDVVNMDGGGSTDMIVRNAGDGRLKTVNYPTEGKPRKVSDSLLIASDRALPGSRSYLSDTTADMTVDGPYTFKITSGSKPSFAMGTPGIFSVRLVKRQGSDYFYQVTPTGAPGQQAGVYVNGGPRLLVLTVGGSAETAVVSDTTAPFTVRQGGQYQFKLTSALRPQLVAGSPSFSVSFAKREGSRWYFKVRAVGRPGQGCGFYINRAAKPVAVGSIK